LLVVLAVTAERIAQFQLGIVVASGLLILDVAWELFKKFKDRR
jgi:hypothetical protein